MPSVTSITLLILVWIPGWITRHLTYNWTKYIRSIIFNFLIITVYIYVETIDIMYRRYTSCTRIFRDIVFKIRFYLAKTTNNTSVYFLLKNIYWAAIPILVCFLNPRHIKGSHRRYPAAMAFCAQSKNLPMSFD